MQPQTSRRRPVTAFGLARTPLTGTRLKETPLKETRPTGTPFKGAALIGVGLAGISLVGITACAADERPGMVAGREHDAAGTPIADGDAISPGGGGSAWWPPGLGWDDALWWAGGAALLLGAVALAALCVLLVLRSARAQATPALSTPAPSTPTPSTPSALSTPSTPSAPTSPSAPSPSALPVPSSSAPSGPDDAGIPTQDDAGTPVQEDVRETLARALAEVAAGDASLAVTEQIDRLLAAGAPDRDALVHACIRHRDQLSERFPALGERLYDALRAAGVREVLVDGQRFDGRVHESVSLAPTTDPGKHDLVAETTRCGYVDGDRVLRVPRVVVYRLAGDAGR